MSEQPMPTEGAEDVTPYVIADLQERTRRGIRKYGRPLQTHNGRDALWDAYEEALDLVQYLRQAILEKESAGQGRAATHYQPCATCGETQAWCGCEEASGDD